MVKMHCITHIQAMRCLPIAFIPLMGFEPETLAKATLLKYSMQRAILICQLVEKVN